jgi:hypothetical protein
LDSGFTWIWTWIWNCGDSSVETSSVAPSDQPGTTWVWDWRWGCEDTAGAPDPGSNTSVSVRVFSPGDNGPVTQSNTSTSTSIASATTSIVQAAQTVGAELPTVPPVVDVPEVVLPPVGSPVLPTGAASAVPMAAAAEQVVTQILEAADILVVPSGSTGSIPPGAAADLPDAKSPSRPARRQGGMRRASGKGGAPPPGVSSLASAITVAGTSQAAETDGHRAAQGPREESGARHRPARLPQLPAPFGNGSDLSAASSAPGTGSPGTGVAILVGALLLFAPSLARWLRVAAGPRPRAPFVRRPTRPG